MMLSFCVRLPSGWSCEPTCVCRGTVVAPRRQILTYSIRHCCCAHRRNSSSASCRRALASVLTVGVAALGSPIAGAAACTRPKRRSLDPWSHFAETPEFRYHGNISISLPVTIRCIP